MYDKTFAILAFSFNSQTVAVSPGLYTKSSNFASRLKTESCL